MAKKKAKVKVDPQAELMQKMAAKLDALEVQVQEKEAAIQLINKTQKNHEIGRQRYGASQWTDWVSGSEKGYHRAIYVDINSMVQNRKY